MKQLLLIIATLLFFSSSLYGGTVIGSRHDLSAAGTPELCEFCHTPHYANTHIQVPLWNRIESTPTFPLSGRPTMNVAVGQPAVASRICLSCHDGVNASTVMHGNSASTKHDLVRPPSYPAPHLTLEPNCERCLAESYGRTRKMDLAIDLGNDHPISVSYPTPAQDLAFKTPTDAQKGWGGTSPKEVKLYAGSVECGSCHNVHDPATGPFLRKSNAASALCLTCHKK